MIDGRPSSSEQAQFEAQAIAAVLEHLMRAKAVALDDGATPQACLGAIGALLIQHFATHGDPSPQTCTEQMRRLFRTVEIGVATLRMAQDEHPRIHLLN